MLHKSAFAFSEDAHGHFLKDVATRVRAMIQQCFQVCGNTVEEAISSAADFQASNLCAKAGVCADESL